MILCYVYKHVKNMQLEA